MIATLKKEIADCRKSTASTTCLARISSQINEDIAKVPTTIKSIAKIVSNYANDQLENVFLCGEKEVIGDNKNTIYLLNRITTCVLDKINHK